jgi:hypothetical protein
VEHHASDKEPVVVDHAEPNSWPQNGSAVEVWNPHCKVGNAFANPVDHVCIVAIENSAHRMPPALMTRSKPMHSTWTSNGRFGRVRM